MIWEDLGRLNTRWAASMLDKLQGFDSTSSELSQQLVAVVQTGDDKCLD